MSLFVSGSHILLSILPFASHCFLPASTDSQLLSLPLCFSCFNPPAALPPTPAATELPSLQPPESLGDYVITKGNYVELQSHQRTSKELARQDNHRPSPMCDEDAAIIVWTIHCFRHRMEGKCSTLESLSSCILSEETPVGMGCPSRPDSTLLQA